MTPADTAARLRALADEVEKAQGADRELDLRILSAISPTLTNLTLSASYHLPFAA